MAKLTLTDITSGFASIDVLNANNTLIETALENTLSRDGTSPNSMNADLDMNGHRILNELAQSGDGFIWQGTWVTATSYDLNNLVSQSGNTYICTVAHTSGTFGTDLGAGKWELLAAQGAAGAGTGDMLKSENLSGLAHYAVARSNLGLAIGTNVQAYDATLTAFAGGLTAANKIPYATALNTLGELDYSTDGTFAANSDTKIPSEKAIKTYVDANSSIIIPTHQTVLSAPVDSNGFPTFLPSTSGSLTLTSQNIDSNNPFVVSTTTGFNAFGINSRVGISTVNITWTSLTNNTTNYLYVDVGSDGSITTGVTTLVPVYQFGSTPGVTAGQATFNIQQMCMYVGNGSIATPTNRVFVGQVVTSAGTVVSSIAYALQGRYDSNFYAVVANTLYTKNHNLGVLPMVATQWISENSDGSGWVKQVVSDNEYGAGNSSTIVTLSRLTTGIRTQTILARFWDETGTFKAPTSGYVRQIISRGW